METLAHDIRVRTSVSGLGFAILSAVSFGLSGSLGRGLLDAGWTSASAVSVRVLVAAVALLPFALTSLRGRWWLLREHAGLLVAYGLIAVGGCQLAYFNAVAQMPVAVALLVEYVAPVAVVGWMWLRHGQRPGVLTVSGGILAAVGLVLVLDVVSGRGGATPAGVAWALGAMAGAAFYFVVSSEDNGLPGVVLATGGLAVGGVALLAAGLAGVVPLAVSSSDVVFAGFTAPWWVTVLALALVTAAVAYVAGIAATRRLGSRLASFVALAEVLAAMLFAWLLLDQLPRAVQLVGALLVLAGVVAVKLGEQRIVAVAPTVTPLEPELMP
ncbi:MAG: EamA family transporter [Nocardioidaceae bacterium]|nr:EamA family transporter [Nocardioidaceae bacterium]